MRLVSGGVAQRRPLVTHLEDLSGLSRGGRWQDWPPSQTAVPNAFRPDPRGAVRGVAAVRRPCAVPFRRPRDADGRRLGCSVTGAVTVTGTPVGVWAPVMRLSSASPE